MHEYAVTQSFLETILDSVKDENIKSVLKVTIEIGPFSFVYFDQVKFWWDILKEDTTILKKAELILIENPGKIFCSDCKNESLIKNDEIEDKEIQMNYFQCSNCQSYNTEIREGRDVKLGELEVEISQ